MDKHVWRSVKTLSSVSLKPSSRWGHSSCVVGEQIVFFGGYADSNYMNDLWAFNTHTMKWRDIQTFGDIPIQRSNCTMNYDKENNQIIIFGGGGANKQRFNSISVLDWNTKNWIQILPKESEVSPWERTYHAAEFLFPYLIVFGGEGIADMEDLWVFNFKILTWSEIKITADKPKPCARRFHSSVLIGNQFMVVAGCYGKYRCLSDIFSIDLTNLIKTGNIENLQWQEKKMKNSSFLTRWGHSSVVYDNKIYIFGGRFSNDLNDLLVADFQTNSIRTIKTNQQAPPARRRHCAGFIGSSMLVFGGFNGQYFQDLHYISLHEPKSKPQISIPEDEKVLLQCLNSQKYADEVILDTENLPFYLNIGLIAKLFENSEKLFDFLEGINGKYTKEQLLKIFMTLYRGYGELNIPYAKRENILEQIPESKGQKIILDRERIEKNLSSQNLSKQSQKIIKKAINSQNILIKLEQDKFIEHFIQRKSKGFIDQRIKIGHNKFQLNRISLVLKSQYFYNLFIKSRELNKFGDFNNEFELQIRDIIGEQNKIVYEIFFNYLQSGFLVLPDNASIETYMCLSIVSDYFMLSTLNQICCNELISMITNENVQKVLQFAIQMKMTNLLKSCCDYWIKKAFENINMKLSEMDIEIYINKNFGVYKQANQNMLKMYSKLRFDLNQTYMEDEKKSIQSKKKQSNVNVEKQNSENNILEPTIY